MHYLPSKLIMVDGSRLLIGSDSESDDGLPPLEENMNHLDLSEEEESEEESETENEGITNAK